VFCKFPLQKKEGGGRDLRGEDGMGERETEKRESTADF
jgi:hypothetical protein